MLIEWTLPRLASINWSEAYPNYKERMRNIAIETKWLYHLM